MSPSPPTYSPCANFHFEIKPITIEILNYIFKFKLTFAQQLFISLIDKISHALARCIEKGIPQRKTGLHQPEQTYGTTEPKVTTVNEHPATLYERLATPCNNPISFRAVYGLLCPMDVLQNATELAWQSPRRHVGGRNEWDGGVAVSLYRPQIRSH